MTTIAIIGAMDEEVAHIAASLDAVTHTAAASLDVVRGTLAAADGGTIEVAATVGGMGLVNAAATTQYLIDLCHPDAVIFSGIAHRRQPQQGAACQRHRPRRHAALPGH